MNETDNKSSSQFERPTGWIAKFRCAGAGLWVGLKSQSSFLVHLPATAVVILLAWQFGLSSVEVAILVFCIALVLTLEFANTAIEFLARSVTSEYDENVGRALDVSAAAVLVASLFSLVIGLIIILPKFLGT